MSDQNMTTENAYHDVLLTITKASLQPDGSVRWQAVASDTGKDKAGEATSIDLFQDWIDRVTYKASIGYLPEPKMPFLGISHYPALDGFGEAGTTRRMYIDGSAFKVDGIFKLVNPIGQKLLDAVKTELSLIKKGGEVEKPIRISAGWWDIGHYHSDSNYMFTRQSLTDKCPLCDKGQTTDKIYKAGQLDHFAATRVPMNPRTSLGLEVKSMAKITRREDAESIIGAEDALEIERRARMVGKSDTEELPAAMVTKGNTKRGGYMRDIRKKKKLDLADVAKAMEIEEARLKRFEDDDDEMDDESMETMAIALKMSADEKKDMLARFGKKRRKEPPTNKAIMEDEVDPEPVFRMGNDHDDEDDYQESMMVAPLGGAVTINEAEGFIAAKQKMGQLYSYWDIFQTVTGNIMMADEETVPDKVAAMAQAVKDLGSKIDTLKAGLSDAFLIQESTVAYDAAADDYEDHIDHTDYSEDDEVTIMTDQNTPEEVLEVARKAAIENKALSREQRETAVQEAFNVYAQDVQGQLEEADPLPQAEQIAGAIKGALADVLGPFTEQLGLVVAKMNVQPVQPAQPAQPQPSQNLLQGYQEVFVPQQKSVALGTPPPVQAGMQDLPVSPITGKPSARYAKVRKSVGL